MTETTLTTKKTPGRPTVKITWPDDPFTVESLKTATGLSKVTLYLKVKAALKGGILEVGDKQPTPQGRPRILFKKVKAAVASLTPATTTP